MNKQPVTVAVSGLNNIDSPGPGIPVIRGLRESTSLSPRIIGLAYDNLEPGAYMHDLVDKTYKVPYPSEGVEPCSSASAIFTKRKRLMCSFPILIPNCLCL
jgi:carbamoyl-phosphate synthase large subunit